MKDDQKFIVKIIIYITALILCGIVFGISMGGAIALIDPYSYLFIGGTR